VYRRTLRGRVGCPGFGWVVTHTHGNAVYGHALIGLLLTFLPSLSLCLSLHHLPCCRAPQLEHQGQVQLTQLQAQLFKTSQQPPAPSATTSPPPDGPATPTAVPTADTAPTTPAPAAAITPSSPPQAPPPPLPPPLSSASFPLTPSSAAPASIPTVSQCLVRPPPLSPWSAPPVPAPPASSLLSALPAPVSDEGPAATLAGGAPPHDPPDEQAVGWVGELGGGAEGSGRAKWERRYRTGTRRTGGREGKGKP